MIMSLECCAVHVFAGFGAEFCAPIVLHWHVSSGGGGVELSCN